MKILHCCLGNYFSDGYAYQDNMLPKYHVLDGHNVMVIAPRGAYGKNGKWAMLPEEDYTTKDGFRLVRIDYKKPYIFGKLFRSFKGFPKLVDGFSPDVIFVHNLQFIDSLYLAKYKKKHPNIKIYVDNHADWVNSMHTWLSKYVLNGIFFKHCAHQLMPCTEKFYGVLPIRCKYLHDVYGIPNEKIQYLEMGVDDHELDKIDRQENRKTIRESLGLNYSDFVIISGGKIDKLKNFHLLMQAVSEIKDKNLKLILFGGVRDDFKKEFESYLEFDGIKHIGWQTPEMITKYILASDLAIMPGTHSVIWEQIVGCGIPAFFKHYDGMEHVDIGENCRFLYNDSVVEIKENIIDLIHYPEKYEQMKRISEQQGAIRFSYSHIARRAIGVE